MKKIILSFCVYISFISDAQPSLDLGKFVYSYSPRSGLTEKKIPLRSDFFSINLNLPLELKKDGDAFLINPFFDHNQVEVAGYDFHVISQGLLIGFLKKDLFRNWNLLSGFIIRRNKQASEKVDDEWQYGGLLLATWKKNQTTSFKFGIYYNKEFFGNYFMPLVGIDLAINEKDNLFGVLPGSMTFEHRLSKKFFCGASFRALTNSYRLQTIDPCFSGDCTGKNYLRADDNQLGVFADFYLTKRIVVTAETGYSILRKYRYGFKGDHIHLRSDYKNDNFYCRAGLAYRLRFR